jgi:CRISPR/Cas system-associated endonuclease Cas1
MERKEIKLQNIIGRVKGRKTLVLDYVEKFIFSFVCFLIITLLFNKPITTETFFLSTILGIVSMLMPTSGKRKVAKAKS